MKPKILATVGSQWGRRGIHYEGGQGTQRVIEPRYK